MAGPALVFEGEEAMITAISENPATFKVPLLYSSLRRAKLPFSLLTHGIFYFPGENLVF